MELHSLHPEVGYQQMFQSEIHKKISEIRTFTPVLYVLLTFSSLLCWCGIIGVITWRAFWVHSLYILNMTSSVCFMIIAFFVNLYFWIWRKASLSSYFPEPALSRTLFSLCFRKFHDKTQITLDSGQFVLCLIPTSQVPQITPAHLTLRVSVWQLWGSSVYVVYTGLTEQSMVSLSTATVN